MEKTQAQGPVQFGFAPQWHLEHFIDSLGEFTDPEARPLIPGGVPLM